MAAKRKKKHKPAARKTKNCARPKPEAKPEAKPAPSPAPPPPPVVRLPDARPAPEEDNGPVEADGLTLRQRAFVDAITGPAMGNATKAAELAGYAAENRESLRVTACRLLSAAGVAEAIASILVQRRLTPQWVKEAATAIAASSLGNFLSFDDRGELLPDFEKAAAAGALVQLREYKDEGLDGRDGSGPVLIKRSIKTHNPVPALALLARIHGLLKDADEAPPDRQIRARRIQREKKLEQTP